MKWKARKKINYNGKKIVKNGGKFFNKIILEHRNWIFYVSNKILKSAFQCT